MLRDRLVRLLNRLYFRRRWPARHELVRKRYGPSLGLVLLVELLVLVVLLAVVNLVAVMLRGLLIIR